MRNEQTRYAPLFFLVSQIGTPLKISWMVGTYAAFFSLSNCITPLGGAFCGMGGSTVIGVIALLVRMSIAGVFFPLAHLAQIVPGMFAGYYWASRSIYIRLVVPGLCMGAFILHPVGGAAWGYTLFWLIPIALYLLNSTHIFLTALGSTFTAHAVGSLIWLYTVPMDAAAWNLLIPVVLFERLLFASGMVMLHRMISWAISMVPVRYKKRVVHTV